MPKNMLELSRSVAMLKSGVLISVLLEGGCSILKTRTTIWSLCSTRLHTCPNCNKFRALLQLKRPFLNTCRMSIVAVQAHKVPRRIFQASSYEVLKQN